MKHLRRSRLFINQWRLYAADYKQRAGPAVAVHFIDEVENALNFIKENPLACSQYHPGKECYDLMQYEFRKWPLKKYPFTIFFRICGEDAILLEAIYAHKMDATNRFKDEFIV